MALWGKCKTGPVTHVQDGILLLDIDIYKNYIYLYST